MNVLSSPYNSVSGQLYGGWKPPKKRLSATAKALIPYRLAKLLGRKINTPAMKWDQKKFDKFLGKAPSADKNFIAEFLPPPKVASRLSALKKAAKWRLFEGLSYPRAYMKEQRKATPKVANTVAKAATAVATMAKAVADTAAKSQPAKKKSKKIGQINKKILFKEV